MKIDARFRWFAEKIFEVTGKGIEDSIMAKKGLINPIEMRDPIEFFVKIGHLVEEAGIIYYSPL